MGTIHGLALGSYIQVHHVTGEHDPADLGGIGLQKVWHGETGHASVAVSGATFTTLRYGRRSYVPAE